MMLSTSFKDSTLKELIPRSQFKVMNNNFPAAPVLTLNSSILDGIYVSFETSKTNKINHATFSFLQWKISSKENLISLRFSLKSHNKTLI